jgi:PAS domain S-box-containing protein
VETILDDKGKISRIVHVIRDITESKRVEDALRESEEEYRNVVERANDGIIIIQDGIVEFANTRMAQLDGSSAAHIIGTPYTDHIYHTELPKLTEIYRRRIAGENIPSTYETVLMRKDGSPIPVELNAGIIMYRGKPADLVIVRDITERKMAEAALMEASRFSLQIIDNAQEGIIVYGLDLKYKGWNPFMEEMTGIKADEVLDRHPLEVFPELKNTRIMSNLEKALQGEVTETARSYFSIPRTGRKGWSSDISTPMRTAGGRIIGVISTVRDITASVQAEEESLRTGQLLESVFQAVGEGIINLDRDFRILSANRAFCEQTHISCEDVIGRHCYEVTHHLPHPCFENGEECAVRQAFETGLPDMTVHMHPDDAGEQYIETRSYPIKDEAGDVVSVIETFLDVTESKRAEKALMESEARFRVIFEQAAVGVLQVNALTGHLERANSKLCDIVGIESDEIENIAFAEIMPPDDFKAFMDKVKILFEGTVKEANMEMRFIHKNGSEVWVDLTLSPMRLADGRPSHYIAVVQDITVRKKAEEKVISQMAELQRWYNLTIGREDRLFNLKKEINELLARLGEKPRYSSAENGRQEQPDDI